jgi:hypothetical protein
MPDPHCREILAMPASQIRLAQNLPRRREVVEEAHAPSSAAQPFCEPQGDLAFLGPVGNSAPAHRLGRLLFRVLTKIVKPASEHTLLIDLAFGNGRFMGVQTM